MKEFSYKVNDPLGIHARPAGKLVKESSKFQSSIKIAFKEKAADAKRIFSVMSLNIKCGDEFNVIVEGPDEIEAAEKLKEFFQNNL